MSSNPSVASQKSDFFVPRGSESANLVKSSTGLPSQESPCSDLTQWRIQRVPLGSSETCHGCIDGRRCNAKIAKYQRVVATPTFLGIERHSKSKETRQVQVWFWPTKLDRCVLGPEGKWIINYPDILDKWPVMVGTSLTQAEVISLESSGFVLDDGPALQVPLGSPANDVYNGKDSACAKDTSSDVPTTAYVFLSEIPLQFAPGVSTRSRSSGLFQRLSGLNGDNRPSRQDGKPFQFVSQPSTEHLKKMEETWSISCSILKYVKVPASGYGVVITIYTPGSLDRKELYEVSISDYPSCSCLDFKFMKVRANRKRKWMPYKHLYFLLQQHFSCTGRMCLFIALAGLPTK